VSRFKAWLKRTPLYPLLRAARDLVRRKTRGEVIERRDARLTARILRRLLCPGNNCVDVGAHAGDILAEFVRLCPGGTHVAAEPIPRLAEALRVRFPTVEVHQVAVTDERGTVEFNVVVNAPALSGIHRRPDLGTDAVVERVSVRAVQLDDIIPSNRDIRLIKVDVEGAELQVFRGAEGVLARWRPWVLFEHGSACAAYAATSELVFDELARHRLAIWKLGDWLASKPALSRDEFAAAAGSGDYWNFLAGPAPDPGGA
jgi:FkbM family methyltransferase